MQIVCFRWLRSATNFNKLKFHYQIYIYTYNFLIKLISVNFYYQIWSKNFIIKKNKHKVEAADSTKQKKTNKKQTKNHSRRTFWQQRVWSKNVRRLRPLTSGIFLIKMQQGQRRFNYVTHQAKTSLISIIT